MVRSFRFFGSERDWEAVDAVVRRLQRSFHERQPMSRIQRTPGPGGRAQPVGFRDLLHRSVFDKRTSAEAISHGFSVPSCCGPPAGGWIGEGFILAGG